MVIPAATSIPDVVSLLELMKIYPGSSYTIIDLPNDFFFCIIIKQASPEQWLSAISLRAFRFSGVL